MSRLSNDFVSYDVVVLGSGPAGQAAALEAAALGKRVAIVERSPDLGGTAIAPRSIPSAVLRAAVVEATSAASVRARRAYRGDDQIMLDDLLWRLSGVLDRERQAVRDRLRRGHVHVVAGHATFVDREAVDVATAAGRATLRADRFVIAVGSRPNDVPGIGIDGDAILGTDAILKLSAIPRTLTVIGAGTVGVEYASIFGALGTFVTVVERRNRILPAADEQVADTLLYHLRGVGIAFHLGLTVDEAAPSAHGGAICRLADGIAIASDVVLVTPGRAGATDSLGLDAIGVVTDGRGRIAVDDEYRTTCDGVFAAGDVASPPSSVPGAHEQGRIAARVACEAPSRNLQSLTPTGIFTIPEISFVGHCERDLADAGVPYVRGLAHYRQLARGEIAGDRVGLLKLLVERATRRLLGVHIFGTAAAELVHVGQAVMAAGLPVDYLVDAPYADPTFADAYRIAAADAVSRLGITGATPAAAA